MRSCSSPISVAAGDRLPAVGLRDVVDQLLNDDGLADAGGAEQSDLAALHERRDEVDDFDTGLEYLRLRLEVDERRRAAVNRPALGVFRNRRAVVYRLANDIED